MGEVVPENEGQTQNEEPQVGDEIKAQGTAVEETAPPEPTDGEVKALQEELQAAQAKAGEYLDGWQRARAEFVNYRKRVERDQAQAYQNASANVIKRFLDVVDDLDRALKSRPQSGEGAQWAEGVELIYRKLLGILESEGVKPFIPLGQPYDPNLEEAIQQEENPEYESGTVIDVVQQGYMLGDRVLRPARVRVAK